MVFDRLAATYGSRLADMWAGTEPEKVKAVWGAALERYDVDTIRRAFGVIERDHPYPPTLPQFLNACARSVRHEADLAKLPAPRVTMPKWIAKQFAEFKRKHVVGTRDEQ